jgi:hypothetical protein
MRFIFPPLSLHVFVKETMVVSYRASGKLLGGKKVFENTFQIIAQLKVIAHHVSES